MDRRAALDGSRVPANHDFAAKYEAPSNPANVATGSWDLSFTSANMAEDSSPVGSVIREIRNDKAPPLRKRQPPVSIAETRSAAEYGNDAPGALSGFDIGTGCRRGTLSRYEVVELLHPAAMERLGASLARFEFRPPPPDRWVPFEVLEVALDACEARLAVAAPGDRSTWSRLQALAEGIAEERRMAVRLIVLPKQSSHYVKATGGVI
jgi:hypothetical protein